MAKLIQTVVTDDLARWAQSQRKEEGVTMAAWLRRLLIDARKEQERMRARIREAKASKAFAPAGKSRGRKWSPKGKAR